MVIFKLIISDQTLITLKLIFAYKYTVYWAKVNRSFRKVAFQSTFFVKNAKICFFEENGHDLSFISNLSSVGNSLV